MPNPTRAEAIKKLLDARTQPDLAMLYHAGMECQVNVARDDGNRKDGYSGRSKQTYTDGLQTWYAFRIPKNAWAEPEDNSGLEMTYSIFEHADAIGMTGWCYQSLRSHWVAFDFDAIVGHSERHAKKMSDEDLAKVRDAACRIPWVTVRRSTSGNGLHLYVFFEDPVPTKNHTQHAALGQAVLAEMSALVGFDFDAKVDACGGNMWVWARKMPKGPSGSQKDGIGLQLVRAAIHAMPQPPKGWERYERKARGERKKSIPTFAEGSEASFEETSGQHPRVPLDEEHSKLVKWLQENQGWGWWDADHHMLVTHTWHLKRAHEALGMRGTFDTLSPGTQTEEQNCFSGDTEVLTEGGVKTLKELAQIGHAPLLVQTNGGPVWRDVEVRSFGTQTTYPVFFGDKSAVWATEGHAWLYYNNNAREVRPWERIFTFDINSRTVLPQVKLDLPVPNARGYAHGFVFGDGWQREMRGKVTCEVAFFKQDNALFETVAKYGTSGRQVFGEHEVRVVRQLPSDWKDLPTNPTKEYAFGFLLGLISADGFVTKRIQVQQSDFRVMCEVERLAKWVGCRTSPLQFIKPGGYANSKPAYKLSMSSYNFKPEHFLRADHKRLLDCRSKNVGTTARVLKNAPRVEEVFCAIVPGEHNFVLSNGVITGNCFCFPMRKGSWSVRRYSPGAVEHRSWQQDGKGWTRCYLNRDPDLRIAAVGGGGTETSEGSFQFPVLEDVAGVVKKLGGSLEVPNIVAARPGRILPHKDGKRVVVEVDAFQQDSPKDMAGWYLDKGKRWRIVVSANARLAQDDEVGTFDELVRHCVTESRVDGGWYVKVDDRWNFEPKSHVGLALLSIGKKKAEVDLLMGASILKPWLVVNRPFEEEYPGDRQWNRSKVRFLYPKNDEVGDFPHWRMVFDHAFCGLDEALAANGWALANDVKKGGEYGELFFASMLQDPYAPLPYLFLWSREEDTGKSIVHEAAKLLITEEGIIEANKVIEGKDSFNGQLEGAVLCYVEELNLNKNKGAYERIKNWVTSPRLSIRRLYMDAYQVANTTHWIHCANDHNACPVFPGDTRITMIHVPVLDPKLVIPKPELMEKLKREAPHFLNYLLRLEIPPSGSRLRLPVINTSEKEVVASGTRDAVAKFIDEFCFVVPGESIAFAEFFEKFKSVLDPDELVEWNARGKVSHAIPPGCPIGKKGPDSYIGNISWKPAAGEPKRKLVLKGRQLVSAPEPGKNGSAPVEQAQPVRPIALLCGHQHAGLSCVRAAQHSPPHVDADGFEWT